MAVYCKQITLDFVFLSVFSHTKWSQGTGNAGKMNTLVIHFHLSLIGEQVKSQSRHEKMESLPVSVAQYTFREDVGGEGEGGGSVFTSAAVTCLITFPSSSRQTNGRAKDFRQRDLPVWNDIKNEAWYKLRSIRSSLGIKRSLQMESRGWRACRGQHYSNCQKVSSCLEIFKRQRWYNKHPLIFRNILGLDNFTKGRYIPHSSSVLNRPSAFMRLRHFWSFDVCVWSLKTGHI